MHVVRPFGGRTLDVLAVYANRGRSKEPQVLRVFARLHVHEAEVNFDPEVERNPFNKLSSWFMVGATIEVEDFDNFVGAP